MPRTRETSAHSQRETKTGQGRPHPPPGAPQRESGLREGPSPLQLGCSREQSGQLPTTQRMRSAGGWVGPRESWGHAEVTVFPSEPQFPIPRDEQPCPGSTPLRRAGAGEEQRPGVGWGGPGSSVKWGPNSTGIKLTPLDIDVIVPPFAPFSPLPLALGLAPSPGEEIFSLMLFIACPSSRMPALLGWVFFS